ncbi:MAG: 2TM domain-containing protein [Burkholderiaceae bacterium]|jgi:transcriptional regulator with XRE-family HTH domain|nr:2TM domain-containing protein [Burkholderiaceae bacterium]
MLIQKLRLQRGWSQQQLAELSGLNVRTIQRIENGRPASTETLKSLASVFEIDFSKLTSEPEMNPNTSSAVEEQLALSHIRRVKRFYAHLTKYLFVITVLAIFNLVVHPAKFWFIWPAMGWGLGLLFHAASVFEFVPFFGAKWEKNKVEQHLGRPL